MDFEKRKNDYTFYSGFEEETEIILEIVDDSFPVLHIGEGYLTDILSNPDLSGNGWTGFTKDYHQFEGAFSEKENEAVIDPAQYLCDLQTYAGKHFHFQETKDVFNAVCKLLMDAKKRNKKVLIIRND
jgi:hypothetical protein